MSPEFVRRCSTLRWRREEGGKASWHIKEGQRRSEAYNLSKMGRTIKRSYSIRVRGCLAKNTKSKVSRISTQIEIETKSDRFGQFAAFASGWLE